MLSCKMIMFNYQNPWLEWTIADDNEIKVQLLSLSLIYNTHNNQTFIVRLIDITFFRMLFTYTKPFALTSTQINSFIKVFKGKKNTCSTTTTTTYRMLTKTVYEWEQIPNKIPPFRKIRTKKKENWHPHTLTHTCY